jgi:hypothetical protein
MDITDKIVKEWYWRFSKGYPDINNTEDKKILDQLLQEWGAPKIEAAPAPILEDDGEPEITIDALMDLLQSKKDSLPPEFLKKIYTQVQTKGKKLTSKLIDILNQKGEDDKTSILAKIPDGPGALVEFLQAFREEDINLTKIDSRPARIQDSFKYWFLIDFQGHYQDENVQMIFKKYHSQITLLGSYVRLC